MKSAKQAQQPIVNINIKNFFNNSTQINNFYAMNIPSEQNPNQQVLVLINNNNIQQAVPIKRCNVPEDSE